MNYIKYSRNMIMLEDQSSDFSANEGPVKGHLKVETGNNKGALRCSVHNLRPYSRGEYIYKLIFFGKKEERTIHAIVGNLVLSRNGSGETYFRFNPQDLDGKGNEYADFSTAIVAAVSTSNEKEPLHPVLKGLTGNEPAQRSYSGRDDRMAEAAGVPQDGSDREQRTSPTSEEETPKTAEAELVTPQMHDAENRGSQRTDVTGAPDTNEAIPPSRKQPNPAMSSGNSNPGAPQALRPEANITPEPAAAAKRPEQGSTGAQRPVGVQQPETAQKPAPNSGTDISNREAEKKEAPQKKSCRTFNHFYNHYLLNACNHSCRSAEFYEEVKPFADDRTGARWKKIVNVKNLPLVSPGAHYFASQYQHYLFGAKPDKDGYACRYFFAIPGRYNESECPDGGKSGFVYWQPVYGAKKERNAYGYWIVAINAETGDVEAVE